MPNWKKVVTSGSNAELNNIDSSGYIDITGASSDPGADGVVRLGESNNALRVLIGVLTFTLDANFNIPS